MKKKKTIFHSDEKKTKYNNKEIKINKSEEKKIKTKK